MAWMVGSIGGVPTRPGTSGDDRIKGGRHRDFIDGLGGGDTLFGGDGNDRLNGGGGDDVLYGEGDNDRLFGAKGDDRIYGGAGVDFLTGGNGADRFMYTAIRDSMAGHGDFIRDFEQGSDAIQFRGDLRTASDFQFIGENSFSGVPGEVRYNATSEGSIVLVDIDGDASADMVIGFTTEVHFQASDFSF